VPQRRRQCVLPSESGSSVRLGEGSAEHGQNRDGGKARIMAITTVDYIIFRKLKDSGLIPRRPSVLELGEAEWYGDVATQTLSESIDTYVPDAVGRDQLHQHMADVICAESRYKSWDLAKIFYRVFLDFDRLLSIDLHGTPDAKAIDLNQPVDISERFDIVLNGGTAEHVFNVFQFFKTVHELTRPNGLMLHVMPFRGWLEHGFYCFNPTFYWDLAAANDYAVHILAYTELAPPKLIQLPDREKIVELARGGSLGENANLYSVMRKASREQDFRIPMQGLYAGAISKQMVEAWYALR